MKTLILIIARLGSTRLKRKHLLLVKGIPIIQWSINRIYYGFQKSIAKDDIQIVLATSDEKENREFETLKNCSVFYGSKDNIPLRLLQCAKYFNCENIISVDGDDILCSVSAMKKIYRFLLKGKEYVKTSGLPLGLNAAGYKRFFLEYAVKKHQNQKLETGWGRIFDKNRILDIKIKDFPNNPDLRFTLDYECDYDFFKKIIDTMGKKIFTISDKKLVNYVIKNKFFLINKKVADEYWTNFKKNLVKEN